MKDFNLWNKYNQCEVHVSMTLHLGFRYWEAVVMDGDIHITAFGKTIQEALDKLKEHLDIQVDSIGQRHLNAQGEGWYFWTKAK